MSDLGERRSVYTRIIHDPQYVAFSPGGKLMFWTLKMLCGPLGITAVAGLMGALEELTSLDHAAVPTAVMELEEAGWIERQQNVLWIVRGLEFERDLYANDPKHRTFVQRGLASLPRLAITDRFRTRYASWFGGSTEGLPSPSEAPKKGLASTEQQQYRPATDQSLLADARAYAAKLVSSANSELQQKLGTVKVLSVDVEQETTDRWRRDGIPLGVAETAIVTVIRKYRPKARARQPNSMSYFDPAVREAFEASSGRGGSPKKPHPFVEASA